MEDEMTATTVPETKHLALRAYVADPHPTIEGFRQEIAKLRGHVWLLLREVWKAAGMIP